MRASVVLLLIVFAASSALSVRAYVLYERSDSATSGVIGASNDVLIGLLNAETGQRGYLLTNKSVYLQPYDAALSTVPADQQFLASQISAVPGGGPDIVELKSLAAAKMAELAQTINLHRAGDHAGALRIVDTSEGKRVMDHAWAVIADLQRTATVAGGSRRSGLRTQLTAFIALAAAVAAVDLCASFVLRRRLRRAGEEIRGPRTAGTAPHHSPGTG
jgi:CHASE3 domain sensor protein